MNKLLSGLFCAALLSVSVGANAATNLLTNGGFEDDVIVGGWQQLPTISGWSTDNSVFELQKSEGVPGFAKSFEGNQYLELNSINLGNATQELTNLATGFYTLSFAYRTRPDTPSGLASGMKVYFGNSLSEPARALVTATVNQDWTVYSYTVRSYEPSLFIKFASIDPQGAESFGSYIDAVSVSAVPEPETYAMMLAGLGLVGFVARRRKNKAANQSA